MSRLNTLRQRHRQEKIQNEALPSIVKHCYFFNIISHDPDGYFKIPNLWSVKISQAGLPDYQLDGAFCTRRDAASLSL